jgi:hypothetical protein
LRCATTCPCPATLLQTSKAGMQSNEQLRHRLDAISSTVGAVPLLTQNISCRLSCPNHLLPLALPQSSASAKPNTCPARDPAPIKCLCLHNHTSCPCPTPSPRGCPRCCRCPRWHAPQPPHLPHPPGQQSCSPPGCIIRQAQADTQADRGKG